MIYRIAIYRTENGQRVFDHYATSEELKYLRVNAEGKVENLNVNHGMAVYPPRFMVLQIDLDKQLGDNSFIPVYAQWLDVSSTHKVEIGFVFEGKKYYHNDILKIWLTKYDDEPELDEFYYAKIYYDPTYDCLMIHDTNLEYDYTFANYAIEWYNSSDSFDSWEVAGNIHENPELTRGGKDE